MAEREKNKWYTNSDEYNYEKGRYIGMVEMLKGLEKLDEPEKVVIPKFVADWIENRRKFNTIYGLLKALFKECEENDLFIAWREEITGDDGNAIIQEIVAKAFLNVNGYTIKEKDVKE